MSNERLLIVFSVVLDVFQQIVRNEICYSFSLHVTATCESTVEMVELTESFTLGCNAKCREKSSIAGTYTQISSRSNKRSISSAFVRHFNLSNT
jgi:hypothetical protein